VYANIFEFGPCDFSARGGCRCCRNETVIVHFVAGQIDGVVAASEALRLGLVEIDWSTGMIRNTRIGELLTAEQALSRGLIDSHIKAVIDNRLRHARSFELSM